MPTKLCSKCGEEWLITDYKMASKKQGYRRSECMNCLNAHRRVLTRKYYEEWMFNLLPKVIEFKCLECGYNKCREALEFHHIDPEDKEDWIYALVRNVSPWGENTQKVYDEVDKCVMLCPTCHRVFHIEQNNIN